MSVSEPEIIVQHRENLLDLLSEAAEIEHNLMCCYLYAAFSLKGEADGLGPDEARRVAGWKRQVITVALDEMTHLALVANLMSALGATPHFGRPNFPISPGYHPAGVVVALAPFELPVLDHFIYLERPEGVELPDGAGFEQPFRYQRSTRPDRLMSTSQDYSTVGHLYRGIRNGLESLSDRLGERALFLGNPSCQVGADLVALPGISEVRDLKSALAAVDTIVHQGEGSPTSPDDCHYKRFLAVREEYVALLGERPDFVPARPVARNPVMRHPFDIQGRVWINEPESARVLDLANAVYTFMLRLLVEAFGSDAHSASERKILLDSGVDLMRLMTVICEELTRMPANPAQPGVNAGVSFAMLRASVTPFGRLGVWKVLSQRCFEISRGASRLAPVQPKVFNAACERLHGMATRFATLDRSHSPKSSGSQHPAPTPPPVSTPAPAAQAAPAPAIEEVRGKNLVVKYEGKRCIHARHCVLGQPHVFLANVQGPWIKPDDATSTEGLVATAHQCVSGAITYERLDGGPREPAPLVNVLRVRENGPLALHAEHEIAGKGQGLRVTLCRCGASKNKPYCDGTHKQIGFNASGEPPTQESTPLTSRNGRVEVRPQQNGPLLVLGNLEICSGTGRTVNRVTRAALCRCGGSSNKPFCDGTHARNGFVSE
jgi:CDGSH-type Zn-finger protein/uncharacterized Fe-S cluster protein YjdI